MSSHLELALVAVLAFPGWQLSRLAGELGPEPRKIGAVLCVSLLLMGVVVLLWLLRYLSAL